MYTYESLEVLTKDKLLTLARFRNVPDVKKYMLKDDIIEKIIESTKPLPVVEAEEPQMSVRVRRIKENQEV